MTIAKISAKPPSVINATAIEIAQAAPVALTR
jgi:hypothetical protein